jgi:hypothetical protein
MLSGQPRFGGLNCFSQLIDSGLKINRAFCPTIPPFVYGIAITEQFFVEFIALFSGD